MNKKEFIEKYPNKKYLWELPKVVEPNGKGETRGGKFIPYRGIMIKCECPDCKEPDKLHFVTLSNVTKDKRGTGEYYCKVCSHRETITNEFTSKGQVALSKRTSDSYKDAAKKRVETCKITGYGNAGKWTNGRSESSKKGKKTLGKDGLLSAAKKGACTRHENNTFMRSYEESRIDSLYGSIHLPYGVPDPVTGEYYDYELDCFWPDKVIDGKRFAVEIDTPDHMYKRQGYHKEKREYFLSKDIHILNIPVDRKIKFVHVRREGYSFNSLIEEFINGSLDEGLEIMWEDPFYIGG